MKTFLLLLLCLFLWNPVCGQQIDPITPEYNPCSFENPSNAYENGLWSSTEGTRLVANDLVIPMNEVFALNQIKVNFFTDVGETINYANISYYEDTNGLPGTVIGSESNIEPVDAVAAGTIFGLKLWIITFDVPTFSFEGQPDSETRYWISIEVANNANSDFAYWETTSASLNGMPSAINDNGSGWEIYDSGTGQVFDGVYEFGGECVLSIEGNMLPKLVIHPNPTSDIINLVIPNSEEIISMTLYDISGKQMDVTRTANAIDVSNLPNGLYILKITSEEGVVSRKIIKS